VKTWRKPHNQDVKSAFWLFRLRLEPNKGHQHKRKRPGHYKWPENAVLWLPRWPAGLKSLLPEIRKQPVLKINNRMFSGKNCRH